MSEEPGLDYRAFPALTLALSDHVIHGICCSDMIFL